VALLESGRLCFSETTDSLLGRFRRVEVTLSGPAQPAAAPPPGWLEIEQKGGLVRFIDTAYERTATEHACRERFPEAAVTASPMTLREIFVTLARKTRNQPNGTAA
jgi:ABC-2 type transport system ATP-binding protein